MKTVITTVGTSLLENLKVKVPSTLKKATFEEWGSQIDTIAEKQGDIKKGISDEPRVDKLCAEIQTLVMIKNTYPNLATCLICTDTILSVICADAIKPVLEKHGIKVHFEHTRDYIVEGLVVEGEKASKAFSETGFPNLIRVVRNIESRSGAENRPILNISGGYKALIPVMTVMGQLYDMEVNYVYEDSEELIKLGKMPINFDFDFGEALAYALSDNVNHINQNLTLKKLLIGYNLIEEKNGKVIPTLISRLFLQFIKEKSILSQSNLGFFLEYLLFHYYNASKDKWFHQAKKEDLSLYYKKGTQYEFTEAHITGEVITVGDIDLIVRDKYTGGLVIAEVKSRNQMENINSNRDYYTEQIKAKIEAYRYRYKKYPDQYLLIVYQPLFYRENVNFNKALHQCTAIKKRLEADFDSIKLRVVGLIIDLKSNKQGISYTELLKSGIQSDAFKQLI